MLKGCIAMRARFCLHIRSIVIVRQPFIASVKNCPLKSPYRIICLHLSSAGVSRYSDSELREFRLLPVPTSPLRTLIKHREQSVLVASDPKRTIRISHYLVLTWTHLGQVRPSQVRAPGLLISPQPRTRTCLSFTLTFTKSQVSSRSPKPSFCCATRSLNTS